MGPAGTSRRVAVLGGSRIPFARSDGAYAEASNQDMFTAALGGLVDRFGLAGQQLGVVAGDANMKAGNSTPLTDGASVALLASDEWAAAHSLTPLAYLVDAETAAVDYVNGGANGGATGRDGLLMAPTYAVPRLLARNGLTLQDFDFYEIHEAFASVVLAHLQAWESQDYCRQRLGLDAALGPIDRSRLNVNGSSLAAGHPFAATGGRILAQLAKQLSEKAGASARRTPVRGLISICAAGGQGVTAILEA